MPEIVVTDAEASPDPQPGRVAGVAFQLARTPNGGRRFLHVSPTCEAMIGVSAAAVIADAAAFYDLVEPDHRARFVASEAQAGVDGAPFEIEIALRRPDGELRWMRITSAPRDEGGERIWDGVMIDVTERRAIEASLEQHSRRLELAAEATGLGFWEYEQATRRLSLSPRAKEIYGWAPDAAADFAGLLARIPAEEMRQIIERFWRIVADPEGGAFSFEHRVLPPQGGERWVSVHARMLADEAGEPLLVGTALDITSRRQVEAQQALIARELAHRAKNGLHVVLGMLSQSARRARTVDELVEVVAARLKAMGRSQEIIGDNPHRPPDMLALMEAVLEPFDRGRFELDAGLAQIGLGGALAVSLALLTHELATNALKYGALSNAGGRVRVERVARMPGRAVIEWREEGGPPVAPSGAGGFGSRLMQSILRGDGGSVQPRYDPAGFRARLEFPVGQA